MINGYLLFTVTAENDTDLLPNPAHTWTTGFRVLELMTDPECEMPECVPALQPISSDDTADIEKYVAPVIQIMSLILTVFKLLPFLCSIVSISRALVDITFFFLNKMAISDYF